MTTRDIQSLENIRWHRTEVSRKDRETLHGHRGLAVWFTGLSGSGKSTIANALCAQLHARGISTYLLDGDNLRHGLNSDLGFSMEDREENMRRVSEVTGLMVDAGLVVITSLISPLRQQREQIRTKLNRDEANRFVEVFVDTPLEVCEQRDPKGLYAKARSGEIEDFTGISSPFEPPLHPEVHVDTTVMDVDTCAQHILTKLPV